MTDLVLPNQYDMTCEPRGPHKLSLEEFEGTPVEFERVARRESIYQMEDALCQKEALAEIGIEQITEFDQRAQPENIFIGGVYVRKLFMPAGTLVVGKRHAQEHVCIISKGRATVTTEGGTQEIYAPMHFVSPAGTKRCVLVHEDMVWTTIHRTDKTEMNEVEAEIMIHEPQRGIARIARLLGSDK